MEKHFPFPICVLSFVIARKSTPAMTNIKLQLTNGKWNSSSIPRPLTVPRVSGRSTHMNRQDGEASEDGVNLSSHYAFRAHSDKELIDEELRCVQCDAPVKDVVCGHRNPCPFCGFPYPVGDCSDLVEN
jgi:hypothetical protein